LSRHCVASIIDATSIDVSEVKVNINDWTEEPAQMLAIDMIDFDP
jgi:hypothetical protein